VDANRALDHLPAAVPQRHDDLLPWIHSVHSSYETTCPVWPDSFIF
jgi:hypothetical protein